MKHKRDVVLDFYSSPDAILNALHQAGWQVIPRNSDKPKPTDEEIAREARNEMRDYFDKPLFLPEIADERDEVFVIILAAIKKAKG